MLSSCEPLLEGKIVVEKSLEEGHGGITSWETPTTLIYEKTTTLYDSLTNVELIKKQTFHNTLKPIFTSKVTWEEDGVEKRIEFDGAQTLVFSDSIQLKDEAVVKAAYKEVMAAQYVLWQPYKLFSDDATLTNEGIFQLEDKSFAYKIKVEYPDSDEQWWYYFDKYTFQLKENLVQHDEGIYSQIVNIKQEEKTGLRLHQDRKSFKVNVLKDYKYLRAVYHYNIISLK